MRALPLCEIFWLILAEGTGAVRGGLSQRRRRGGNMFSNQLHSFRGVFHGEAKRATGDIQRERRPVWSEGSTTTPIHFRYSHT